MQRNITHQKTLALLLPLALILIYPPMEAIYPLLPPLFGIAYVKWREAIYQCNFAHAGVWMLYTLVLESVWGLPLYGTWCVMFITFTLFDPKITHILHLPSIISAISVLLFDMIYLIFLYGYSLLMHTRVIDSDLILIYYLLVDILGVLLF
ncbi:MAG: hypothetical protein DSY46_01970 [Hydrogenimonas sp.]|nr:MAG: hypothetical protein DSY46_01970 [Hydrogenimonas sp.]